MLKTRREFIRDLTLLGLSAASWKFLAACTGQKREDDPLADLLPTKTPPAESPRSPVELTAAQEVPSKRPPDPTPVNERPPVELVEGQPLVTEDPNPKTTPEVRQQISPEPIYKCRVNKLLVTLDVCHGQNRSLDHEAITAATDQGVPVLLFISSGALAGPHQYLTENGITFIKNLQEQDLVTVGSHGHLHLDAAKVSLQEWKQEVKTSVELLTPIFGRPVYFRYPFDTTAQLGDLEKRQIVTQYGMAIISHSFETGDPAGYSAERIYQAFKKQGQSNEIIIGHANIPHISHIGKALPTIIDYAQKQGWQFAYPDECLSGKK